MRLPTLRGKPSRAHATGMNGMRIALVGLGAMGGGMAHRLLVTGWALTLYNRKRGDATSLVRAGARVASSAGAAAAEADVFLLSLSDEAAVEHVLFAEMAT